MKLTEAGQPEILRAAQRDDTFKLRMGQEISEVIHLIGGVHFWIKYKDLCKTISDILYQVLTTMCNLQTLGEEYTQIVQVNPSHTSVPHKYVQFLMILLNNCGEKLFKECLQRFEKYIKNLPEDHPLLKSRRNELIKMSVILRSVLPFINKTHKAIFYFNGDFYEISKRICGIKYVLVRYWMKNKSSLPAFKILGIISLLCAIIHSTLTILNLKHQNLEQEQHIRTISESDEAYEKCPLCLHIRKDTSITPCGHLFCWTCIITWLQEQPKCPLCRQMFQPSRVVLLQNYTIAARN